jgi:hypothetical protein
VLANQVKGAVTKFLIVPRKDEFERVSGWRFFKDLRRWLEGELDDDNDIVKDLEQQQMARVTLSRSSWTHLHTYYRSK